ncbi:MAG: hypothetical protein N2487_04970 [Verrucomicrobiae bacterium]|nr:hypothetical protein [Verrucomicrobiae bacterium]
MKLRIAITILSLILCVRGAGQTTPIYINERDFTGAVPPQIDATAFVNQALFSISVSPLPFQTQNTLYYTNKGSGVMTGSVGFRFDYFNPQTGLSYAANTFVNNGTITGDPFLIISATNIVNTGFLFGGATGLLHLDGGNVDLSRSGLRTGESIGTGIVIIDGNGRNVGRNYYNAPGVVDYWWGVGTNNSLGTNGQRLTLPNYTLDIPYTTSPSHEVRSILYGRLTTNIVSLPYYFYGGVVSLNNYGKYTAAVYTNTALSGDRYISVVFYPTNNTQTNFSSSVYFYPNIGNGSMVIYEVVMTDFDIVLQTNITSYVYLIDSSAVATNFTLFRNYNTNTFRPNVFELTRTTPFELTLAVGGNSTFTNSLFYNSNFETNSVNILYAGYSALINETNPATPLIIVNQYGISVANPALSDPTNSVGRIEIDSGNLNLNGARIRSEKFVSIKATNLVNNALTRVDAPVINYDLGTTNRVLELSNIVFSTVNRLSGMLSAYSAVWTNRIFTTNVIGTNIVVQTNTAYFHVLVVDNALTATRPVVVNEFAIRATNAVIYDNLTIAKSILFEGEGLRIARSAVGVGGLTLPDGANWSSTNFPRLKDLTNSGYIKISGSAYFYREVSTNGTVKVYPYNSVLNYGSLTGATFIVRATNLVNSGAWGAVEGVASFTANKFSVEGGYISAKSDITFEARELVLSNASIIAGNNGRGALILNVTNRLVDGGAGTTTIIKVNDGFQMLSTPTNGNLLYTTIESRAERFAEVTHTWAGKDYGVSMIGFNNNAALGKLVLDGQDFTRFVFRGAGTNSAMYVDYIEFKNNATNYSTALYVEPNLTIYFASANLPVMKLNNALGGRLKWVPTFAGPNSSTYITLSDGRTVVYNTALLLQPDVDSDRDGIPNLFDPTPVPTSEDIEFRVRILTPPGGALISWNALAQSTNRLEFTTNLNNGRWQTLTNFVNTGSGTKVNVVDTATNGTMRFYRLLMDLTVP